MELNKVYNTDCLAYMKTAESDSVDILYTDVPYNLGTKYIIDNEGHYVIKGKGSDFMNRWEVGDGRWWNDWFKEAYRIIKPGGYLITHNIDRQSDLWTYYGRRNGFYPTQKLYWLFIDNFPKGVDTAQIIDKYLGVEREKLGLKKGAQTESTGKYGAWGKSSIMANIRDTKMVGQDYLKGKMSIYEETIATSDLAKKYDGYKHGIAPAKQVMEEIIVLWKEQKLSTTETIIRFEEEIKARPYSSVHPPIRNIGGTKLFNKSINAPDRWTPQLAVHDKIIREIVEEYNHEDANNLTEPFQKVQYNSEEMIQYRYVKKANVDEKEYGLENLPLKTINRRRDDVGEATGLNKDPKFAPVERKNIHPTSKPIELGEWVLRMFALPDADKMIIFDPFAGSGSILISAQNLGMQYIGTELSEEYYEIATERLKAYKNKANQQPDLFGGL